MGERHTEDIDYKMIAKQLSILAAPSLSTPNTEGIKYIGSKLKILPHILNLIGELDGIHKILDGFSGSTRVSQAFAQLGYEVTANDIAIWSEVFAVCYLKSSKADAFYQNILDHLNNLKGYDGWYTEKYGAELTGRKRPFQIKNTRKLDAIRDEIERLNLAWEDKCVILSSLIYALDSVDSTLGHYVSYLSKWSSRSHHDLFLKLPKRFKHNGKHQVLRSNIFDVIKENQFDLVYFDPPYGSNNEKMPPSRVRYAAYYHIWTTIIKHDKPDVFGKVNRRTDSRDLKCSSVFEEFRKGTDGKYIAMKALHELVQRTNARYILLSYSSGGRTTKKELSNIIDESGTLLEFVEIDYKKNVMANMRWSNDWINDNGKHREYLFLMERRDAISAKVHAKERLSKSRLIAPT